MEGVRNVVSMILRQTRKNNSAEVKNQKPQRVSDTQSSARMSAEQREILSFKIMAH